VKKTQNLGGNMPKYDYLSSLTKLADAQMRVSVILKSELCNDKGESVSEISDINRQSNSLCAEIDAALFDEFLPPIERVSISACAHGLSEIVGTAFELSMLVGAADRASRRSVICEEMSICTELSEKIYGTVSFLCKKNPRAVLPDTYAFRLCLNKGRGVHSTFALRASLSDSRRDQSALILGIEHYRRTLARVYDKIIEAILYNV
jgi:hypothetical protein